MKNQSKSKDKQTSATDQRIQKNKQLFNLMTKLLSTYTLYCQQCQQLMETEQTINKLLESFYDKSELHMQFLQHYFTFTNQKQEAIKGMIFNFKSELKIAQEFVQSFNNNIVSIEKYTKFSPKLSHYQTKVEMLQTQASKPRTKTPDKFAQRLQRNQKKLEFSRIQTMISVNNIIQQSDEYNIKRFDVINPLVIFFINFEKQFAGQVNANSIVINSVQENLRKREGVSFNDIYYDKMPQWELERLTQCCLNTQLINKNSNDQIFPQQIEEMRSENKQIFPQQLEQMRSQVNLNLMQSKISFNENQQMGVQQVQRSNSVFGTYGINNTGIVKNGRMKEDENEHIQERKKVMLSLVKSK